MSRTVQRVHHKDVRALAGDDGLTASQRLAVLPDRSLLVAHGRPIDALPARLARSEIEDIVVDLCAIDWWEPSQLAGKIRRSRQILSRNYLRRT